MFLLHIQAEMVPTANISHKTMPITLWDVPLTHPGSNGAYGNSQTHAHHNIYYMFLLHIQAKMEPTRDFLPQTHTQYALYRMFHLHIQAEMVPMANISHKTMPRTLSMGCFSYTSWLKWCLQELLLQTNAKYAIYRMFFLHIQAEMVPTVKISQKTMPSSLSTGCFSYPG